MNRQLAILVVGVAAAIAAYSLVIQELRRPDPVAPPGAEPPAVAKSIDDEPALPPTEPVIRDALSNGKSAAGQSLAEPSTEDSLASERARLPQEFDVVFGEPTSASPLSLIHARFMHEPRDESWAIAMESGINQAVVRSDVTDPITIEHVECRSTICEVAGYMQDAMKHPELDPSHLFPEDLGVGWWQGRVNMAVGQHTFEGEPFTRCIVIIADAEVFLNGANRVNVPSQTKQSDLLPWIFAGSRHDSEVLCIYQDILESAFSNIEIGHRPAVRAMFRAGQLAQA